MKSHAEWLREAAIYTGFGRTDFDAGARDRMREIADELESSALKLEASVKAHNEIFDALRDCEEKRNEQSSRLEGYEKWHREHATVLASHRIGGYYFNSTNFSSDPFAVNANAVERQSQKCGKQFLAGAIAGIKSCALTVGHEGSCANHE